jgi:hypothetical protein
MISQNFKAVNLEKQPRKIDLRFLELAFSNVTRTCRNMCFTYRADFVAYQNRNVRRLFSILGKSLLKKMHVLACSVILTRLEKQERIVITEIDLVHVNGLVVVYYPISHLELLP